MSDGGHCAGGTERSECTDKLCGREAEFAYRFDDDFSRARNPEDDDLEDGDLAPYVCRVCRDRMAAGPHMDADRFVRPEETLIPAADGGNARPLHTGMEQSEGRHEQD